MRRVKPLPALRVVTNMSDSNIPMEDVGGFHEITGHDDENREATLAPFAVPTEKTCAVETTLAAIGGKWKPILLYHLLTGPHRYSRLQRLVPRATDRMLTRSLRELEQDQLLTRSVYAEVPVRVEYELTSSGRSLVPILQAMSDWGRGRS